MAVILVKSTKMDIDLMTWNSFQKLFDDLLVKILSFGNFYGNFCEFLSFNAEVTIFIKFQGKIDRKY